VGTGRSPAPSAAVRWWSNSAVAVGSKVDPAHPDAAAKDLQPSQADYCGMLKQTVGAGKSILPDSSTVDPTVVTTAQAFVAEIEKVAPAAIKDEWQQIGPAVLSLVKSGGDLSTIDLGALTKAGHAINADSKASCDVDLSSVISLLPTK
jgi:hypothetical protein